jgi:tight adherence protein B
MIRGTRAGSSLVGRLVVAGSVVAAVAGLVFGAVPAHAQEPPSVEITSVDASGHPEVSAIVATPSGLAGVDYPPEAFEVLEDGETVDATVERMATGNLEVVLAFDTSGSMDGEPLVAARSAAAGFLDGLPADVRVGVVGFGPTPTLLAEPTTDRDTLRATIDGLTVAGETALYDGVVHASQQFTDGATDRVVVLLSDGGDTASSATLEQAEAAAGEVTLNVINLVTSESNPEALDRLAAAGQGSVSAAGDPAALGAVYEDTAQQLANRYSVDYASSGGGEVDLTVRLTTDDGTAEDTRTVVLPGQPTSPSTSAPDPAAAPAGGDGDAEEAVSSGTRLLIGAGAMFLALLLLGLAMIPGERRRRVTAETLGAQAAPADRQTPSEVTQRMAAAADEFLERQGRREALASSLDVAGISLRTGEFAVLVLAATVVGALAGLALVGPLGVVLGLVAVPLAAWFLVRMLAERRRERFAEILPDTLQLLTSSIRSGYGLLQALDTLAREAPEPAGAELRRVLLEVRVGRDPGDALRALATRMQSEDFEWVVGAIEINREVGGDLAAILDNVAETIRERQRLYRQMRALTAEGRLGGYVLTALPVVLALALVVINPEYIGQLGSGLGLLLLSGGAVMLVVGWLWIRRMCRLEM